MANHLALRMDRSGAAEMSCIAGLGGDVKALVRLAKSGCPVHCGRHTLARHGVTPDLHWDFSTMGVKKLKHVDFDPADAVRLEPLLGGELKQVTSPCP